MRINRPTYVSKHRRSEQRNWTKTVGRNAIITVYSYHPTSPSFSSLQDKEDRRQIRIAAAEMKFVRRQQNKYVYLIKLHEGPICFRRFTSKDWFCITNGLCIRLQKQWISQTGKIQRNRFSRSITKYQQTSSNTKSREAHGDSDLRHKKAAFSPKCY